MITRIDAAIQKRFDAVVHAFMRRTGASKRAIRRNGWGLACATIIGGACVSETGVRWFDGVILVIYALWLLGDDRKDSKVEGTPFRSVADHSNGYLRWLGWFWLGCDALLIAAVPTTLSDGFGYMFTLVLLFQGYLANTSPEAPQKKRETTTSAQLASATALLCLLLVACETPVPCVNVSLDKEKKRELFRECMGLLPAGPAHTHYNDWDEVVRSCEEYAQGLATTWTKSTTELCFAGGYGQKAAP